MSAPTLSPADVGLVRPQSHERERRMAAPRVATSVTVTVMILASLAPSLLPRSPLTQAVVTGVLATVGLGLSVALHRLTRRAVSVAPRRWPRRAAAGAGVLAVVTAGVAAARWQGSLRSTMGVPPASPLHWIEVTCGAVSISAISIVVGVALARAVRRAGAMKTIVLLMLCALGTYLFLTPMAWSSLSAHSVASNSTVDAALPIPTSPFRSGSAESLIPWQNLGREGRKFAAGGQDTSAVRTYVGLGSATSTDARAELAVRELDRSGGFDRSHLVVAVPTGSGWIDENAVSGLEERFDGDVATVGMQYSYEPSWATFLFARDQAKESASALLDAVASRIADMPVGMKPDLYVYGQSLGSVGGSAAAATDAHLCGALWAGPPAGQVDSARSTVLANTSDPVVWWSTDLIGNEPDLSAARTDAPVPRWLPVVSFLQTTVDLVSALGAPAGHGHRYGMDQGTLMPDCQPVPSGCPESRSYFSGPRAASYAAPMR